jgi:hypothetical protein
LNSKSQNHKESTKKYLQIFNKNHTIIIELYNIKKVLGKAHLFKYKHTLFPIVWKGNRLVKNVSQTQCYLVEILLQSGYDFSWLWRWCLPVISRDAESPGRGTWKQNCEILSRPTCTALQPSLFPSCLTQETSFSWLTWTGILEESQLVFKLSEFLSKRRTKHLGVPSWVIVTSPSSTSFNKSFFRV